MLRRSTLIVLAAVVLLATPRLDAQEAQKEPVPGTPRSFRVLVFSKTAGFRHGSIPVGIEAIKKLGQKYEFDVDATEDAGRFTDEGLAGYGAVIFLNTTGDVLDETQQAAFEKYIRAGGGYVGVHSAADTEYDWPWYGKLVGAYFKGHPPVQEATVIVTDRRHPATRHLPAKWSRRDEWYAYRASPRGQVHVLAQLDETTYQGGGMAGDHPIAWCHAFEGGRAFYTGGGHTNESYAEPLFRDHLLGGIRWAAGVEKAKIGAGLDDHFEKVVLDDYVTDPMELAVAPHGRVIFVERGGVIKIWKPDTRTTVSAGFVDVYAELEDGLLGVTLDPRFADNGWLYIYYAPAGDEPKNVLSRLTLVGDLVDPASEIVMLEVATQRDECCHSGGSLAFDTAGDLYISTGDNTSPFASDGYSPIDERPGRSPFDAQKSSASTGDLRGKILRITPQGDGSYAIPAGNLFTDDSHGRPEIYVMGCRNPFRISIDRDGTLYWGEVGPDASGGNDSRGPPGFDEFNRARAAGNFGWPYLIGNNQAYHDYDFEGRESGDVFDPARPINESPNKTGARVLPPAQPAWIWYEYGESPLFPALGSGGRCAMAGPVYYHDDELVSPRKLPAHYDGALFLYEWARDWIMAVRVDEDGTILSMERFLPGVTFKRPMDLEIGPDGCLYAIEWGTGFGGGNADAQVVKIEHFPSGARPPRAVVTADRTSGPAPLAVSFSSAGSRARATTDAPASAIETTWDFDGDGVVDSRDADPRFVYRAAGRYTAQLTVTDAGGLTAVANVPITAGNTAPRITIDWPPNGAVHDLGSAIEYFVTVEDAEDVLYEADRAVVQSLLGHDTHAHPLQRQTGFTGALPTIVDDGHGADADLFTVLAATYTDGGGDAVPLTARDEIVLQPRRKQAEHHAAFEGTRIEKTDDPDEGGQHVVFSGAGQHVVYRPIDFHAIDAATLRVATGPGGGVLELRIDAAEGPLVGRAVIAPRSGLELAAGAHPIRIEYFERTGGAGLILRMAGAGSSKAVVEAARLRHGDCADGGGEPGLAVAYYELDDPTELPDFGPLEPATTGVARDVNFASTNDVFATSGLADRFGAVFTGAIILDKPGAYSFFLESDDGSRLYMGDELVVDNDGLHGMSEASAAMEWVDVRVPIEAPAGTRALYVVRTESDGDASAPMKLNWIEFHGAGGTDPSTAPTRERGGGGHHHDATETGFVPLFDGATLDGWRRVGGGATYDVDDGTIVGRAGPGANTFLRTERVFRDFVLRLDVRLDEPGNSGIQFRSHQRGGDGVVYGYQCEIDPSKRSWSGGLYDESRRGWLDSLEGREAARAAFKRDGWNAFEIRAVGDHIQTWVNGVPCADYRDAADADGFVALQVHGGGRGQMRWRNVRIREIE